MPPRVAILCEFPTLNGGERSLLAALGQLNGARTASADLTRVAAPPPASAETGVPPPSWIEPVICCPASGPLAAESRRLGLETVAWETRDATGTRRPQSELLASLQELVDRVRPDLLHANSLAMGRLTGAAAPFLAIPTTSHLRDIVRLSAAAVADLNRNVRLAAVSEATRAFHVAQGVDPARVVAIPNGVDRDRFHPRDTRTKYDDTGNVGAAEVPRSSLRASLALPDDAFLIATIGQIGLRKGHDILARAATLLAAESGPAIPSMHFLIVGERYSQKAESREFEQAMDDVFRTAGLSSRLHRLGYRDDVAEWLPEVDLLAHPARQEPLGRVLLEAAACGVAIVATDVGGTAEILTDDDSALLVPPDDPAALAAAIARLASDATRRARLGSSARRQIASRYDLRHTAPQLAEFWFGVLRGGVTAAPSAH